MRWVRGLQSSRGAMRILICLLSLSFLVLAGCVPPTGLMHVVPGPTDWQVAAGGGAGTDGAVGSGSVRWSSARNRRNGLGVTATAVASTDARTRGVAPYFAMHVPAGPLDVTVPMFLAAGRTGPGLYSDVGVYAMTGLMLSHRHRRWTFFGGALSSVVGVEDRLQASLGARLDGRHGTGLTTEAVYMRERFVLQLQASFGRVRRSRAPLPPTDESHAALISGGTSALGTGYLLPLFPVGFTLADDPQKNKGAALCFIPVVGPLMYVHSVPDGSGPIVGGGREFVLAYTSSMTQLMGLALLVSGHTPVVVPTALADGGTGIALTGRF